MNRWTNSNMKYPQAHVACFLFFSFKNALGPKTIRYLWTFHILTHLTCQNVYIFGPDFSFCKFFMFLYPQRLKKRENDRKCVGIKTKGSCSTRTNLYVTCELCKVFILIKNKNANFCLFKHLLEFFWSVAHSHHTCHEFRKQMQTDTLHKIPRSNSGCMLNKRENKLPWSNREEMSEKLLKSHQIWRV